MTDDQSTHQETDEGRDDGVVRSREDLHRALGSVRRRRLLSLLLDDPERNRGTLATLLAGWEATTDRPLVTRRDRNRIEIDLHHRQLPLLDDLGFVSYDPESETVVLEALDEAAIAAIDRATAVSRPEP